jgi:glycogen operon protein
MLLGGDEMSRGQDGNNNPWCVDSELTWFDWGLVESNEALLDFTRRLIRLRREHPVLRRDEFLSGEEGLGSGLPDAWWFRPDGLRMTQRNWGDGELRTLGVFLNGLEISGTDASGERVTDDSFLVLFNGGEDAVDFRLPTRRFGAMWTVELMTAEPQRPPNGERLAPRGTISVPGWSTTVLRRVAR